MTALSTLIGTLGHALPVHGLSRAPLRCTRSPQHLHAPSGLLGHVTHPISSQPPHARAYGTNGPEPYALACARKRRRYDPTRVPGCALVPFALEAAGRVSEDALALIRHVAPHGEGRGRLIAQARQELSILIHQRRAQLLLSAERQHAPA